MVVVTVWIGYAMAPMGSGGGLSQWVTLLGALVGTALSCMGSSVLNQIWEQDTDALMERTRTRPCRRGTMTVRAAVAYGLGLSLIGLAVLAWTTNW